MSRVILVRHAKSDYPPGVLDHDRPLSRRGVRNAQASGGQLAEILSWCTGPFAVAVSTARRAQQTWELVHANLAAVRDRCSQVWNDRSLYLADPDTLVEVGEANLAPTLVIVGHNPGLEQVAAMAAGAAGVHDKATGRFLSEKLPTSSIVVLDSPDAWRIADSRVVDFRICR